MRLRAHVLCNARCVQLLGGQSSGAATGPLFAPHAHARLASGGAGVAPAAVAGGASGSGQHASAASHSPVREAWQAWGAALLGVAAAAALHAGDARASADAVWPPADQGEWQGPAQAAARAAVTEAWQEAVLDHQRWLATAPSDIWCPWAPPPQQPQVALVGSDDGSASTPAAPARASGGGALLSVSIPLARDAHLPGLLHAIDAGMAQLAAHSSSCSQQQQSYLLSTQKIMLWDLQRRLSAQQLQQQQRRGGGGSGSSGAAVPAGKQQLSVQVVVPLQGSSPHESSAAAAGSAAASGTSGSTSSTTQAQHHGHVIVQKPGPFTSDELDLLRQLVVAANRPTAAAPGVRHPSTSSSSSMDGTLLRGFEGLGGALLGSIVSELLSELQSGWQEALDGMPGASAHGAPQQQQQQQADGTQQGGGGGGSSGGWRWQQSMARFFGGLPDRLLTPAEQGQQPGQPVLPDDFTEHLRRLEQHLQQQLAAMAPPEVREWLRALTDQEGGAQEQQQAPQAVGGAGDGHRQRPWGQPKLPGASSSSSSSSSSSGGGSGGVRRYSSSSGSSGGSMDGSSSSSSEAAAAPAAAQAPPPPPRPPLLPWQQPAAQAAMRQLQQLGAAVYLPEHLATATAGVEGGADGSAAATSSAAADTAAGEAGAGDSSEQKQQQQQLLQQWGVLAGYEAQKQALEDCLLLPLKHPEVYERVSSRTRRTAKAGGARPRAVLFEGPPGTGKTSTARVLAGRASLPLVYVPLEMLASKWYGESEQNMAKIFKACEGLGGCIIFLDELDSLATSRDSDMHEASRRLLGVLLREVDGFNHREGASSGSSGSGNSSGSGSSSRNSSGSDGGGGGASTRSVVIGATNRRQDLDAALLSRFDLSIHFGLPDEPCREAILVQYAHHLSPQERQRIAAATQGFSGRDLRDVCEQTERTWASHIIRGRVHPEQLPGLDAYLAAVEQRRLGAGRGSAAAGL